MVSHVKYFYNYNQFYYNERNINFALTLIISYHNGRIVLSSWIQLDQCNVYKVISDKMAQLLAMINANGRIVHSSLILLE